jgi:crossover junction endodeoxyribonuclease RuvC
VTRGFGLLEGVATVVPHSTVIKIPPRRWQKWWGIKKADKEFSRELASEHFPVYADRLARKKDHNRAEALLIAEYTRRKHKHG